MHPSAAGPVVVHVIGKGRSGSTLLDTVLGQVPGVVSTGELRHLWGWGVEGGYRCGCGEPVRECPLWSEVLERLATRLPWTADTARARAVVDEALRWPRVPTTLLAARRGRVPPRLADFVALHEVLYREIASVSGAGVVVDSSKWPAHPALLGMVPGIRPAAVHLVRDPRGVANSYRVGKATDGDQPDMPRFGAAHSAISWDVRNLVAELIPRVGAHSPSATVRLRYEDLVQDPEGALLGLVAATGIDIGSLGFVDGDRVTIAPTHTVGGNPGRFTTGDVTLRPDERWRRQLSRRDRRTVEVLTAPLRHRYGYRGEDV